MATVEHAHRRHPFRCGLVQRGPITYLVATAFSYDDVRLYAVRRMQATTASDDDIQHPQGFSPDDVVAGEASQFGACVMFRIETRISKELATILGETPLASDQQLHSEGMDFLMTATVSDSWQLRWWTLSQWTLSQGWAIEVLSPALLRNMIGQRLAEVVAHYESPFQSGEDSDE